MTLRAIQRWSGLTAQFQSTRPGGRVVFQRRRKLIPAGLWSPQSSTILLQRLWSPHSVALLLSGSSCSSSGPQWSTGHGGTHLEDTGSKLGRFGGFHAVLSPLINRMPRLWGRGCLQLDFKEQDQHPLGWVPGKKLSQGLATQSLWGQDGQSVWRGLQKAVWRGLPRVFRNPTTT